MEYKRYKLGDLITQRREKYEGDNIPIAGISREGFMPPKQVEADTSIYNVFYLNDFVFNPARMELNSIVFNDVYPKAMCSSLYEMFYVHKTDVIMPEYLNLYVKRDEFARHCEFLGSGSAREYCRVANISEIELDIPSLEEQQKIVRQYSIITNRIGVLERINEELTNFIVKYNGYFIKEHGGGEELGSLEQLCESIYSGGTPSTAEDEYWNGDLLWLSSGETSDSYVVTTEKTITSKGVKNSSTKLAEKGSTVIASAGQGKTRGQTSYLLKDMYVNQSVIVLKPQKNCGAYIFSNLKGRYDELRTGSDLNAIRGSLTTTEVKAFPIFIPTNDEMQEYYEKIQPILDYIEAQVKEIQELELLRESIIEKNI